MGKPLIEVKNLSKSYGLQKVLHNLSFQITEGDKIALIGRNGAGKSTLLKILLNEESADEGNFKIFPQTRIGLIKQHEILPKNISTLNFLCQEMQKEEWEVRKMASKFSINEEYLNLAPTELSGGYQMRIKVIKMLLADPNLLLLDEPVNYLDLQTLLMLQDFLKNYRGSMLIIAHDRDFLEETCEQTYEIERGELTMYKGKVSNYLIWKEEQKEFKLKTNKKLAREISHTQKFVDRFRYKASLASQAQSKIKYINKLKSQLSEIKTDLAKTKITIPSPKLSKGVHLRINDLSIGYDEALVENINFDIMRGEKILIAGENGQGKSTLLKTILNKQGKLTGEFKWWHKSNIGYYDQKTDASLNENDTVMDHLMNSAPRTTSAERILMMAGNFLFTGHDLDKKINMLSGGERARLCLAGILLKEFNTLILDEPTNHLDVETADSLAEALKKYDGTVIFVSHVQSFVKKLADKIYEIRDKKLRLFLGNYEDYIQELKEIAQLDLEIEENTKLDKKDNNFINRKEIHLKVRTEQRMQEKLTNQISNLEKEKSDILKFFFENPTEYNPQKRIKLDEIENELLQLEEKWLQTENKIEKLRDELK